MINLSRLNEKLSRSKENDLVRTRYYLALTTNDIVQTRKLSRSNEIHVFSRSYEIKSRSNEKKSRLSGINFSF